MPRNSGSNSIARQNLAASISRPSNLSAVNRVVECLVVFRAFRTKPLNELIGARLHPGHSPAFRSQSGDAMASAFMHRHEEAESTGPHGIGIFVEVSAPDAVTDGFSS